MTRLISNKFVCVTMFVLFVLALAVNTFGGGTLPVFGGTPVLAPVEQKQLADGPIFPPDPFEGERYMVGTGGSFQS